MIIAQRGFQANSKVSRRRRDAAGADADQAVDGCGVRGGAFAQRRGAVGRGASRRHAVNRHCVHRDGVNGDRVHDPASGAAARTPPPPRGPGRNDHAPGGRRCRPARSCIPGLRTQRVATQRDRASIRWAPPMPLRAVRARGGRAAHAPPLHAPPLHAVSANAPPRTPHPPMSDAPPTPTTRPQGAPPAVLLAIALVAGLGGGRRGRGLRGRSRARRGDRARGRRHRASTRRRRGQRRRRRGRARGGRRGSGERARRRGGRVARLHDGQPGAQPAESRDRASCSSRSPSNSRRRRCSTR
jgi:hypothetical protein